MGDFDRNAGRRSSGRGRFERGRSGGFSGRDRDSDRGGFGGRDRGGRGRPEMHQATCDKCGKDCEVPFRPTQGKPLYCDDCFRDKSRESGSRSESAKPRNTENLDQINEKLNKILKILEGKPSEEKPKVKKPKKIKEELPDLEDSKSIKKEEPKLEYAESIEKEKPEVKTPKKKKAKKKK